ncbi:hypothetical protein PGQ11_002074 [Apiospora arundinis]|uniref:Uncharacterized protein n=1 Tax=Apiospora arundinis TaxID=335852 RepID=A0ABR2JHQ5_9PEZI
MESGTRRAGRGGSNKKRASRKLVRGVVDWLGAAVSLGLAWWALQALQQSEVSQVFPKKSWI